MVFKGVSVKKNYYNSKLQQFLTEIFKMFDLTNEKNNSNENVN